MGKDISRRTVLGGIGGALAYALFPGKARGDIIAQPYDDLQAVANRAPDGSRIILAPGTHAAPTANKRGVYLVDRDLTFIGQPGAILTGQDLTRLFTVIRGKFGVESMVLEHGQSGNDGLSPHQYWGGGAVAADDATVNAKYCQFREHQTTGNMNGTKSDGGAINVFAGTLNLEGCVIRDCKATHAGGGVGLSGTIHSERCLWLDNEADDCDGGGGFLAHGNSTGEVVNFVVKGNETKDFQPNDDHVGGFCSNLNSNIRYAFGTIIENKSIGGFGGAFYVAGKHSSGEYPTIVNCAFGDNVASSGFENLFFLGAGPLTMSHCVADGGIGDAISKVSDPSTIYNADPLLDPADGITPMPGSPCLGAGVDVGIKQDYLGNPRPLGDGFEIGAVEVDNSAPVPPAKFSEEQVLTVDENEHSWFMRYNYDTGASESIEHFELTYTVPFPIPKQNWVGGFLYDVPDGNWTEAFYGYIQDW